MNIDYGTIIKRSFHILKNNKWLWVYALTLALLGGGGLSSFGSGGWGSSTSNTSTDVPKNAPEESSKVLGAAITAVKDWFFSVPIITWIFIAMGILGIALAWIVISWIVRAWARGGLIAGLDDADSDKPVNLLSTSPRGIATVKPLLVYGIISTLFAICIMGLDSILTVVIAGIGLLFYKLIPIFGIIWIVLSALISVVLFIVLLILLSMISIYADRLIVLKNYTPWDAWKKGLSLSRGNFIPTVFMAVINSTIGCFGGCLLNIIVLVLIGIPGFVLAILFMLGTPFIPLVGIPIGGGILVLFMILIALLRLAQAAVIAFKYSTWTLFFKEVWNKKNIS